jgi:hypothetical protein
MTLDFNLKDRLHRVTARFVPFFLPTAKKKYRAKAVQQTELDLHAIASKAAAYNLTVSPAVIEEGMMAGMQLMMYLAADSYRLRTPLFTVSTRIPGEYDGTETHLPHGVRPEICIRLSPVFRNYIGEHVQVTFDGIARSDGFISHLKDEMTGLSNLVFTPGNILTVSGAGLKIAGDPAHAAQTGAVLQADDLSELPVTAVVLNRPGTLKLLMPHVAPGGHYRLVIRTQSLVKPTSHLLKNVRKVQSDITLVAQ